MGLFGGIDTADFRRTHVLKFANAAAKNTAGDIKALEKEIADLKIKFKGGGMQKDTLDRKVAKLQEKIASACADMNALADAAKVLRG